MAAAALVVSVLALCVAVGSAVASWRSARAARAAQHRAETPVLDSAVVPMPGGGHWLRLRNRGPHDLDGVVVHLVPARQPHEPMVVGAVSPESGTGASEPAQMADLGELPRGQSRDVRLWLAGASTRGPFHLRSTCRRGGEQWTVLIEGELPGR